MTTQNAAATTFQNLNDDYTYFNDSVREEIAALLGEAMNTCTEDARPALLDRAKDAYEFLDAMFAILRHAESLMDRHHGFVVYRNRLPGAIG